jgi:hypothetical protein
MARIGEPAGDRLLIAGKKEKTAWMFRGFMSVLVCINRPEIDKNGARGARAQGGFATASVLHTGQHEDMVTWPLYEFFDIQPDEVIQLERREPGCRTWRRSC